MGIQQVSTNTGFSFPVGTAGAGKNGETAEDFAELVRQEDVAAALFARDRQRLIERERIAEVGFVRFQCEQHEIQKMLRLMKTFAEKAPQDMQREFEKIIADLEENPPHHPLEMYARIEAGIERISATAPSMLKQRMKEAYAQLREEMEKYDPELERLEKMERQKRLQTNYHPEALVTAAFL